MFKNFLAIAGASLIALALALLIYGSIIAGIVWIVKSVWFA